MQAVASPVTSEWFVTVLLSSSSIPASHALAKISHGGHLAHASVLRISRACSSPSLRRTHSLPSESVVLKKLPHLRDDRL